MFLNDEAYLSRMKLDLHVHSKFSPDSFSRLGHILRVAKRRGINGIAITDHNSLRSFSRRLSGDVIIIKGSEVKTEIGDLVGLFLTEPPKSDVSLCVIDEIRDQGGLVILPHPFKHHKLSTKIIEEVDAIEAFNARVSSKDNERATRLCMNQKKPMVAGSDAHFPFEVGRGLTLIPYASSEDDVRKAILNRKTSILGVQFSSEYLSMLYTVDKMVEAAKNPRNIPRMASKSFHRFFPKLGRI